MHGARGGAPEGEQNGNYKHGARTITRDRLSEMFEEAGANGLTFPEIIEAAFPGLDEDECLRLAAILEHATTD